MRIARQVTLATMAEKNARLYPSNTAVVCGNTRVTYSAFNHQANRLARIFRRKGVSKGNRVAILSRNCHRFVEGLFALSKLGAILVPLNWRLSPGELSSIVRDSDSMILVLGEGLGGVVQTLRDQLSSDIQILPRGPRSWSQNP